MSATDVVADAWQRWQVAKARVQAEPLHLRRGDRPSVEPWALEARAAYAEWWRLAGEHEAATGKAGFRREYGGHWDCAVSEIRSNFPAKDAVRVGSRRQRRR